MSIWPGNGRVRRCPPVGPKTRRDMTFPSSMSRSTVDQKLLFRRFRQTAFSFRHRRGAFLAGAMVALIVMIALMQVGVQYLISLWTRDFFNALESHRARALWQLAG